MHKAYVAQFDIAARDPDVLRRFYALLFGWWLSPDQDEARELSVTTPHSGGIEGVMSSAGDGESGGLRLIVEVEDVLENVCYAEELGGRIVELPLRDHVCRTPCNRCSIRRPRRKSCGPVQRISTAGRRAPAGGLIDMPLTFRWRATLVIGLGLLMAILDITIVSAVLPQIAAALGAEYQTTTWVGTGYLLANAAVIPIVGYLSDRIGSKTIFLLALGAFIAGSALCAVASSVQSLTAFRVFQGVGGGALLPVGMAIIFRLFDPAERAAATSMLMIPILLGLPPCSLVAIPHYKLPAISTRGPPRQKRH
jgi:predicted enzyme related to lactoylglutathione lyase